MTASWPLSAERLLCAHMHQQTTTGTSQLHVWLHYIAEDRLKAGRNLVHRQLYGTVLVAVEIRLLQVQSYLVWG